MTESARQTYEYYGPYSIDLNAADDFPRFPRLRLLTGDVWVGLLDTHGNKIGSGMLINTEGIIFEGNFVDGDI